MAKCVICGASHNRKDKVICGLCAQESKRYVAAVQGDTVSGDPSVEGKIYPAPRTNASGKVMLHIRQRGGNRTVCGKDFDGEPYLADFHQATCRHCKAVMGQEHLVEGWNT